jgi:hypothetical protein
MTAGMRQRHRRRWCADFDCRRNRRESPLGVDKAWLCRRHLVIRMKDGRGQNQAVGFGMPLDEVWHRPAMIVENRSGPRWAI